VSMPGVDGVQVTQMITASCPRVKVIAFTRHDDASFVRRLLDVGAAGYVLKQSASTELTRAIRAVAAGERYIDNSIRGSSAVPTAAAPAPGATDVAELTTDEEQVLRLTDADTASKKTTKRGPSPAERSTSRTRNIT